MKRAIALIPLALALIASPSIAQAGVLTANDAGYGEEYVNYEAQRDPASVIVARSLTDGRLLITDSKSRITLASPDSPLKCDLHGQHAAICRRPSSFAIASVKIHAGNHGDVIDARGVSAYYVTLEGGAGNDTLLAPKRAPYAWTGATVSGGSGYNVIVGNSYTTVSYAQARGPVTVDLNRDFGVAPHEHDHIVGAANIYGSQQARNTLIGSRSGGVITGGPRGNLIVALSRQTSVHFERAVDRRHTLPSTIVCLQASTIWSPEPIDTLADHCKVENVTLQLPLRSPSAAVLTLDVAHVRGSEERHVELLAGPEHTLVGELNYRRAAGTQTVPCRLNAVGRELLRRQRRLNVIVKELYSWLEYPGPEHLWEIFTTTVTLARGR